MAGLTPNDDRLEVRVDPAFKARLKAAAKADHRSLSSFVISRLEAALSSSETPEPVDVRKPDMAEGLRANLDLARVHERERRAVMDRLAGSSLTRGQQEGIAETLAKRKPPKAKPLPLEAILPGPMCRTCEQNGPPKARPCAKCGHQR